MGLWALTDQTGTLKAVHIGHHDVQRDKSWKLVIGHIHSFLAVLRRNGVIAQMVKCYMYHIEHIRIVFYNEDLHFNLVYSSIWMSS